MKSDKKLRYIAYVRKSSEDKERQELSHISQIENIKEKFGDLNIVAWMEAESRSAFTPGRPIFDEMMELIDKGKADAIVSWHPNRLSRNEVDSAKLTYLLRSKLKDLQFCSYNFDNTPEGIMMLQIVMNQGQYESTKQGREVSRGMETKADTGEKPGRVMPGYMKAAVLDDHGQPVIHGKKLITKTVVDPERYDIIKQMWKWYLYERLSPQQIWKKVNGELNYRTPVYRNRKDGSLKGDLPMNLSGVYRIFASPFYAGQYYHNGVLHEGNYQDIKMITWDEYKLAQDLLGIKANARAGTFEYAFASMIKCGVCGCQIQARHRTKWVQGENMFKTYVYYYCSRKSMHRPCNQTVYTLVEDVERDIEEELKNYTIIPEFKDLALKILSRNHKVESSERTKTYERLHKQRTALQSELDGLVSYLHRELIDEDDYKRKRSVLKVELVGVDEKLRNTEKRANSSLELNEKAFNFAVYSRIHFQNGDVRTKRDILRTLGQGLILRDNKLYIEPNEWLKPIGEHYSELESKYLWVRTNKKANSKELELALEPIFESWRAVCKTIATKLQDNPTIFITAIG
jgi:site-specific DNA recombinase